MTKLFQGCLWLLHAWTFLFKFESDSDAKYRAPIMIVIYLVPLVLVLGKFVSFVDALYFSGTFCAAIMAILPVFMVNKARREGDIEPVWNCGWMASTPMEILIVLLYGSTVFYAIFSVFGLLPAGW
ncbi:MAG: aromatic amino acid transport family protein [Acidaminococcus intestini]